MVLAMDNIFGNNRGNEVLQNPDRAGSVIVALDGSGDTDDIQDGINLLPSTGGSVLIKDGTYTITAAITFPNDGISLIGSGESTIIYTTANIKMLSPNNKDWIRIKDVKIQGNDAGAGQYGIYVEDCNNIVIDSVHIRNVNVDGIFLHSSDDAKIFDSWINNCGGDGIFTESDRTLILGTTCKSNGGDGFVINGCVDCVIMNCYALSNGGDGFHIENLADYNSLEGNRSVTNTGIGVNVDGAGASWNLIATNYMRVNGGLELSDTGSSTVIRDNIGIS